MKQNSKTGSRLFFIEFLIVLFFFLIISTVCLRLFVRAHTITQRSEALSRAQAAAASVASVIEAGNALPKSAAAFFPDASVTETGFVLSYDSDFQPCPKEKAFYTLLVTITSEKREVSADITVQDCDHRILYELPVSFHLSLTRKEALQ